MEPVLPNLEVCLFDSCVHFREIVSLSVETQSLKSKKSRVLAKLYRCISDGLTVCSSLTSQ